MKTSKIILLLVAGLMILSCSDRKNIREAESFLDSLDTKQDTSAVSGKLVENILQQIPSPLEMSMLIKSSGLKYDNSVLSNPDDYNKYNTSFKQAINLGIYGTDLMYTNIFDKDQDAVGYIKAAKSLANDLNIGQYFNIGLITELAVNRKNFDSLMLITVRNFNDINDELQQQHRSNMSAMLLVGGWLEGLHLVCSMAANNPADSVLTEKIGEQKIFLEKIVMLINYCAKTDPDIRQLSEDIAVLNDNFNPVTITYTYEKPTYEVKDGILTVVDHSSNKVTISPEDVRNITASVQKLRDKVIL
jgi:hypothetical protein